jgi:hypothetical protein
MTTHDRQIFLRVSLVVCPSNVADGRCRYGKGNKVRTLVVGVEVGANVYRRCHEESLLKTVQ